MNANLRFVEGIYFEDNIYTYMLLSQANRVSVSNEKYYIRRVREDSIMTSKLTKLHCKSAKYVADYFTCYIAANSNDLSNQYLEASKNFAEQMRRQYQRTLRATNGFESE
jgi:hypothetical protein